jgi:hypothetical protein
LPGTKGLLAAKISALRQVRDRLDPVAEIGHRSIAAESIAKNWKLCHQQLDLIIVELPTFTGEVVVDGPTG